ncbi:MAG: ABC transporter ATP-binding protein [Planctomycetes bacterium]|nr:ABC transporter ATP-binding protein [Planctomycetota bacterium]
MAHNGDVHANVPAFVVNAIPGPVREQAVAMGLKDEDCIFSACSDIGLDDGDHDNWVLVTAAGVVTLAAGAGGPPLRGPFGMDQIRKIRLFQAVGSAFLQLEIDGTYVDVAHFSNALRDTFSRLRSHVEQLVEGKPLVDAPGGADSRRCSSCGLPLAGGDESCPRCKGGSGITARSIGLMKPYWKFSLIVFLMLCLRVALSMIPPYLVKVLVDRVLEPRSNVEWLLLFVLGLLAVAVMVMAINVVVGWISSAVGARIGKELREKLHEKLLDLNVKYFDRHPAGGLMSRVLWDVEYFHAFVDQVAGGFLLNVMMVLGIGIMLFYMNWQLALMVMVPIPLVIVGTTLFWKHVYPKYYPVWETQSKMAQHLSGVLSGIRMVKVFGQESRERTRFGETAAKMKSARFALQSSSITFSHIMVFVFGLGGLIIWYYGGRLVLDSRISLGTLMAFFSYVGMFYGPVHALSMFSNWMTGFVSAGRRVFEVLDSDSMLHESPRPAAAPDVQGAIEFRNVTFGYEPHTPVIHDVSFRIEPGQFVGLVGRSGSGKTTLVNLVCRFYDPQEGEVLVDGVNVRDLSRQELRRRVALVLQDPFLFRASIRDNIAYGCTEADPVAVIGAAKAANAHGFISKLPGAYDTKLGEMGAGLSGGERQRVTIARAIARQPQILVLDEATSSVDTEAEFEIQKALARISRNRTTIAIAHRLTTLKNADRILVMDSGSIIERGTHRELLAGHGVYANMVNIQSQLACIGTE